MTEENRTVTVTCGANVQELEVEEGTTIGSLTDQLSDVMNIPSPRQVIVGGQTVNDDHVISPGEQIEIVKPAGVKA